MQMEPFKCTAFVFIIGLDTDHALDFICFSVFDDIESKIVKKYRNIKCI